MGTSKGLSLNRPSCRFDRRSKSRDKAGDYPKRKKQEGKKARKNIMPGKGGMRVQTVLSISKPSGPPMLMLAIGRFERKWGGWMAGSPNSRLLSPEDDTELSGTLIKVPKVTVLDLRSDRHNRWAIRSIVLGCQD